MADVSDGPGDEQEPSKWGKGKTDPATWWKKGGPSPNPKGRPKGSKGIKTIYKEAFEKKIEVTMDGEPKTMMKKEVSLHQMANKAAGGDDKATAMMLGLEDKYGPVENTPPTPEESAADFQTLDQWIAVREKFRVFEMQEAEEAEDEEEEDEQDEEDEDGGS